jgi:imidazolonepropionase-like amidohydrolase
VARKSGIPAAGGPRTAVANVRVFDGDRIGDPTTVVIDGGALAPGDEADVEIDGACGILLPGLIDAHVHLHELANLEQLASFGVTTALDMASWPPSFVDSLRGRPGVTDIRSAGGSATAPGSVHSGIPDFPPEGILAGPEAAAPFVARRVAEGSDYIKVIADIPGPDAATLAALVSEAHAHGKLIVAHAAKHDAYAMAVAAGCDVLTHVPLDRPLDAHLASQMVEQRQVAVPTLTMMEGIVARLIAAGIASVPGSGAAQGPAYANARDSVGVLYASGVPVLAGTDSNAAPFAPAAVAHGESLHRELELLVAAGASTLDALRAATALPATHFGLDDRGHVAPGLRADLVLLRADPLQDITNTRTLAKVWCAGAEHRTTDAR